MRSICKLFCLLVWIASAGHSTAFGGVVFTISYDDTNTGVVGDGNIVGTGVLSYDGVLTPGNFLLSDLPNLAYSSNFSSKFPSSPSFTLSNLREGAEGIGIWVTDEGGGNFSMVFTGVHSGIFQPGPFFFNLTGRLIHQQNFSGGGSRVYGLSNLPGEESFAVGGDYIGVSSVVPEPVSLVMWSSLGVIGFVASRRKVTRRSAV
jgi:hypothetical protein